MCEHSFLTSNKACPHQRANVALDFARHALSGMPCVVNSHSMLSGCCWRMRASIPLPIACKAIALPFELIPQVCTSCHYATQYHLCWADSGAAMGSASLACSKYVHCQGITLLQWHQLCPVLCRNNTATLWYCGLLFAVFRLHAHATSLGSYLQPIAYAITCLIACL